MKILASILALLFVSGCASSSIGHDFDMATAERLPAGTPYADVVTALGRPYARRSDSDGGTTARWLYVNSRVVPFSATVRSQAADLKFNRNGGLVGLTYQKMLDNGQ